MCQKFTPEQLKNMDMETKDGVIFQMQDRLDKLEHDYENLIEQIRLANQQRFVSILRPWSHPIRYREPLLPNNGATCI